MSYRSFLTYYQGSIALKTPLVRKVSYSLSIHLSFAKSQLCLSWLRTGNLTFFANLVNTTFFRFQTGVIAKPILLHGVSTFFAGAGRLQFDFNLFEAGVFRPDWSNVSFEAGRSVRLQPSRSRCLSTRLVNVSGSDQDWSRTSGHHFVKISFVIKFHSFKDFSVIISLTSKVEI